MFDSLGKLLAPTPAVTAPAASNRTLAITTAGQGRCIALVERLSEIR